MLCPRMSSYEGAVLDRDEFVLEGLDFGGLDDGEGAIGDRMMCLVLLVWCVYVGLCMRWWYGQFFPDGLVL